MQLPTVLSVPLNVWEFVRYIPETMNMTCQV